VKKIFIVFILFCLTKSNLIAQFQVRDSILFNPHVTLTYGYHLPTGDMARRFGLTGSAGLNFHIKDKKSRFWGVQANYLFGNRVSESGLMQNLYTEKGEILDNQGQPAIVFVQERGWQAFGDFGHLFPVIGPNKNSGLLVYGGAGYLFHKIRIEHQSHEINALTGDNLRGYDRLTSGPAVHGFVGYSHLSNNRRINFLIGLEATQAWTQSVRGYNYDTQAYDHAKRHDGLVGFKVGWILNLYQRAPDAFYIN
jgi:hypothetical protein